MTNNKEDTIKEYFPQKGVEELAPISASCLWVQYLQDFSYPCPVVAGGTACGHPSALKRIHTLSLLSPEIWKELFLFFYSVAKLPRVAEKNQTELGQWLLQKIQGQE